MKKLLVLAWNKILSNKNKLVWDVDCLAKT